MKIKEDGFLFCEIQDEKFNDARQGEIIRLLLAGDTDKLGLDAPMMVTWNFSQYKTTISSLTKY